MTTLPMIGIMGKARSGKDTVADLIAEEYGYVKIAFATPVYAAVLAIDPLIYINGDHQRISELVKTIGWDLAKDHADVRSILQRTGTEMGRGIIGEDVWINIAFEKAAQISVPVVFSDVRFPNEADAIVAQGGYIIEVLRHGSGLLGPRGDHDSETKSVDIRPDFIMANNGTLDQLRSKVIATLGAVINRVPRPSMAVD